MPSVSASIRIVAQKIVTLNIFQFFIYYSISIMKKKSTADVTEIEKLR
jgi:hypothetical protein